MGIRNPFRGATKWFAETGRRMREHEITRLQQEREILLLKPDSSSKFRRLGAINSRLAKLGV